MGLFRPFLTIAVVAMLLALPACSSRTKTEEADKADPRNSAAETPESRRDKEITKYAEMIKTAPEKVNDRGELPQQLRGRLLAERGDHDAAIADFTEAIRLYPKITGPYCDARLLEVKFARGKSYRAKRQFDESIADFTSVIGDSTKFSRDAGEVLAFGGFKADALLNRGAVYDEIGATDKATADFEEAIRIAPDLKSRDEIVKRSKK